MNATRFDNNLPLGFKVRAYAMLDRLRVRAHLERHREQLDEVETACLFIGHARSGHSVIASCIDAHPDAAMAHRFDAVKLLEAGYPEREVFCHLLKNAERLAATGRILTNYSYAIPGQWQGRVRRLRLIGDQEGHWTSRRLGGNLPFARELLRREHPRYRLVYVIRNPYDNITTWARRSRTSLDYNIERYFNLCAHVREVAAVAPPGALIELRHEDFLADPKQTLSELLSALGLEFDAAFLGDCASIVYPRAHRSRTTLAWSAAQIQTVRARIDDFEHLAGYRYED